MEWLIRKRIENNLTQAEVANRANIARTTYAMIEQGRRLPSVPVAKRIATVMNFKWTLFFEDISHETCSFSQTKEVV